MSCDYHCSTRKILIPLILLLLATAAQARPRGDDPVPRFSPETPSARIDTAVRSDTLHLFAASGPGAWGEPGTDERGYTFDGPAGGAEAAGWTPVDLTAQEGAWWHIESTALCAGHATDMSGVPPFAGGDNLYALWCGRANVCGWENTHGYGNGWEQHVVLDCGAWSTSVQVRFHYVTDFEGGDGDRFDVLLEVDDGYETLATFNTAGPTLPQSADITAFASDYQGQALGNIVLRFSSDSGGSDQDGLHISDMGPVWVDNLILAVDGAEVGRSDFEDNIQPTWIEFTTPAGAGNFGALYRNLFSEDICLVNITNAWAFFDEETIIPEYPIPVIKFGPPYVHCGISSPLLESAHSGSDPVGQPLSTFGGADLTLSYLEYCDTPLDNLVGSRWSVSVQTEETPCLRGFLSDDEIFFDNSRTWVERGESITIPIADLAAGETITGIAVRLEVVDMCDVWCGVHGTGASHSPAPYFDNIRVGLIDEPFAAWDADPRYRLQDNFPEADTGFVRIDCAADIAGWDQPFQVIGDSTVIGLSMARQGGLAAAFCPEAGEERPELRMYFRVIAGPNAGSTDPAMGDPDDGDGIHSPWTGTQQAMGETWNVAVADYAASGGIVEPNRFAFDLNDAFFLPGDIMEYFYVAKAMDGSVEANPATALDPIPYHRETYFVRCLPSAGGWSLFVDDGDVGEWWNTAFEYTCFLQYDVYTTQAPAAGLGNGLAGRASASDLSQYNAIIWDSGSESEFTVTSAELGHKTADDALLTEWLNEQGHDAFLWILGNEVATELMGTAFLGNVLGVECLHGDLYYDDYTGIYDPRVWAVHSHLQWLGGPPGFQVDGSCPTLSNYSPIVPNDGLVDVSHEWETTSNDIVAGVVNWDPDGNGLHTGPAGYFNRTVFNAFTAAETVDLGYGLPANRIYTRLMVKHILANILGTLTFDPNCNTAVDDQPAAVTALRGNHPNPFNPTTAVSFSLAEAGPVELAVYDVSGRKVVDLVNGRLDAGPHEIEWRGTDGAGHRVASGVYFCRLTAGEYTATEKMTLLK